MMMDQKPKHLEVQRGAVGGGVQPLRSPRVAGRVLSAGSPRPSPRVAEFEKQGKDYAMLGTHRNQRMGFGEKMGAPSPMASPRYDKTEEDPYAVDRKRAEIMNRQKERAAMPPAERKKKEDPTWSFTLSASLGILSFGRSKGKKKEKKKKGGRDKTAPEDEGEGNDADRSKRDPDATRFNKKEKKPYKNTNAACMGFYCGEAHDDRFLGRGKEFCGACPLVGPSMNLGSLHGRVLVVLVVAGFTALLVYLSNFLPKWPSKGAEAEGRVRAIVLSEFADARNGNPTDAQVQDKMDVIINQLWTTGYCMGSTKQCWGRPGSSCDPAMNCEWTKWEQYNRMLSTGGREGGRDADAVDRADLAIIYP